MATEASNSTTVPTNLHTQDLSQLDIEKLTPSTPEVISRQATINIGTIGHVAHGKSTIVKALSGVQTVRFKNELEKNITIKLERLEFDVNGEVIMPKEFPSLKRKWEEEDGDEKVERKPIKVSSYAAKKGFFAKEYVVEKILDYAYQYGEHSFFVKWEGWNEDCNTWEPYEHLSHCSQRIEEYFLKVFNVDVINKMCKLLSVSQNLTNKSLESIIPSQGFNALKDKLQLQLELLSLNSKPIISAHYQKIKRGKENLLLYFLHTEREKQVKLLTEWENSVNAMSCEQASILVENEVDLEVLPDNFTYVNDYVPMEGVDIPQNPPIGCNCETCTPRESECCGRNYSTRFTYRDKGRLNLSKGQPIYECNKMCTCDMSCRNRVIQNGRKIPLCIFRTNNGRGWGVKSTRKIYPGEFVCEYVGEVISHDEAEKRGEVYDAQGRTYLFDLDFNMSNNPYTVDAAKYGNISHFINHSCEPNLGVWAAWINCLDPNLPKLALFAIREIQKDEEITFDYMAGSNDKGKSKGTDGVPKSPTKSRLDLPDQDQNVNRPLCKCDTKGCRRYLF